MSIEENEVIVVRTVRCNGELLFYSQDIFLDQLEWHDFHEADITVVNKWGQKIDSGKITKREDDDLDKRFALKRLQDRGYPEVLLPESFEDGDILKFILTGKDRQTPDFRKKYEIETIFNKMGGIEEIMKALEIKDREARNQKFRERKARYHKEKEQFKIPSVAILRRRSRRSR